jgi:dephospho-CoA kinase
MMVVGLTGSIAAGKSTVASRFRAAGFPVFDADLAVHQLYASKPFSRLIEAAFPGTTSKAGVDRSKLSSAIQGSPQRLTVLEQLVHPRIRDKEHDFLKGCKAANKALCMLDIPLLFETGRERDCHKIIVVTAPESIRKLRAMSRPGMTEEKWKSITSRQWPDSEKCARADYVLDNTETIAELEKSVDRLIIRLIEQAEHSHA